MTDRIVLRNIQVHGRHGVSDEERAAPQPFEVDVEMTRDLQAPGESDELSDTIDYSAIDATVRRIVGTQSFKLLESIAETISREILASTDVEAVLVRVRKPAVRLAGPIDYAGVEITRWQDRG
jgi:7,8-dihydroneopterin aldolase/epimerase/oxygenase